jgi:hypothetical protein
MEQHHLLRRGQTVRQQLLLANRTLNTLLVLVDRERATWNSWPGSPTNHSSPFHATDGSS